MCSLSLLSHFCFLFVQSGYAFSKFIALIEKLEISKWLFGISVLILKDRNSKPLKNTIISQTAMRVVLNG
jgi:hypothetical protein